jgi:alpha-tubulin suppressor-like RCC1 family protein
VRCWGENQSGQLGNGTKTELHVPPTEDVLSGVKAIATGYSFSCAVMLSGGVRCWGGNSSGQLGNETKTNLLSPPTTDAFSTVTGTTVVYSASSIAGGDSHTCIVTTTGGVRCWGYNYYGQLGGGSVKDALQDVQAVSAGMEFTCALTNAGGVRCWGLNDAGQLGDGTTTNRDTPPSQDVLSGVQAIACGNAFACALTTAGGVRCWGLDNSGQLGVHGKGNGKLTKPSSSDVITGVKAIAAAGRHACALTTAGGVRCWGSNAAGQLGNGFRATPAPVLCQ